MYKRQIDDSDTIGAEAAAITHGHTLGWLPAVALVHICLLYTSTINNHKRSLKASFYIAIQDDCVRKNPFDFKLSEVLELSLIHI